MENPYDAFPSGLLSENMCPVGPLFPPARNLRKTTMIYVIAIGAGELAAGPAAPLCSY